MTVVKSNVSAASDGGIIGPNTPAETWAQHFSNRSYTSIQDQINAGYPIYMQPGNTADGYYEEDWDYGSVVDAGTIICNATLETLSGTPTSQIDISYKLNSGDAWTTVTNTSAEFARNFRYFKVRVNFLAAAGTDLLVLRALSVTVQRRARMVDFVQDLGAGRSSGTFDLTGLADLTPDTPVLVTQSAAAIASKGNARDEIEFDAIQCAAYALNATTIRVHWRATGIVVGDYAFTYMLGD